MTITLNARKAAAAVLAILVLVVAYLVGTTHSGSAEAAAATGSTTLVASSTGAASSGITMSGLGTVSGKPDTLRLELAVTSSGGTVTTALASANATEIAVQKSLLGNGVAAKDLQTSGLSIQPDYAYSKTGTPSLRGYQVSETLTVALRDLGRAGDAIGAAVSAGGNSVRINQISLSLEDTSALVSGARDQAFSNAKAKAQQYAKAAGRELGDVVTITEAVQNPTPVQYGNFAQSAPKALSLDVPIQTGSQDVNVSVTVQFGFR